MIDISCVQFPVVKNAGQNGCNKIVCGLLTSAGASGKLYANTTPSSFGERAQGRSERGGPCFFPGRCV